MPSLQSHRLQCLAPFETLGDIAKTFGVELTLYGGTASRAAMHLFYRPEEEIDIFELVPFSSDIDLEHTGPATKTYNILLAIQEQVPFASWFRWSIIDQERAQKAAAQRDISTRVPLRQVRFSNARDPVIPEDALHDLEKRCVSFTRNPAYHDGGSDSDRRDIEIYGLMMAMNVGAELRDVVGDAPTFDGSTAAAWLSGTAAAELSAAAATPRLAARFWHLLAMQLARLGRSTDETVLLLKLAEATGVLRNFDVDLESLGAPGCAFSVSKFTENDNFRIPELSPDVFCGKEARESFRTIMKDLWVSAGMNPETFPGDVESLIDPAFDLVAKFGGRAVPLRYEVVSLDPPRSIVLEARKPSFTSRDTITVAAAPGGSTVHYDARLDFTGVGRLFDPLMQLIFKFFGSEVGIIRK